MSIMTSITTRPHGQAWGCVLGTTGCAAGRNLTDCCHVGHTELMECAMILLGSPSLYVRVDCGGTDRSGGDGGGRGVGG